jgi:hypothetical protein
MKQIISAKEAAQKDKDKNQLTPVTKNVELPPDNTVE